MKVSGSSMNTKYFSAAISRPARPGSAELFTIFNTNVNAEIQSTVTNILGAEPLNLDRGSLGFNECMTFLLH